MGFIVLYFLYAKKQKQLGNEAPTGFIFFNFLREKTLKNSKGKGKQNDKHNEHKWISKNTQDERN